MTKKRKIQLENDLAELRLQLKKMKKKQREEFINAYTFDLQIDKTKSESLLKIIEVISIPLMVGTVGIIISLFKSEIILNIIILLIALFSEILMSAWLIKRINMLITQFNMLISLCEEYKN